MIEGDGVRHYSVRLGWSCMYARQITHNKTAAEAAVTGYRPHLRVLAAPNHGHHGKDRKAYQPRTSRFWHRRRNGLRGKEPSSYEFLALKTQAWRPKLSSWTHNSPCHIRIASKKVIASSVRSADI